LTKPQYCVVNIFKTDIVAVKVVYFVGRRPTTHVDEGCARVWYRKTYNSVDSADDPKLHELGDIATQ